MNDYNKVLYMECECYSPEHMLKFEINDYGDDDIDMVCYSQLTPYLPWYWRIWAAIRYIFGYESKYGHWDCFIFQKQDVLQLKYMCFQYLEKMGTGQKL